MIYRLDPDYPGFPNPEEAEPEVNAAAEEQKGASNSEKVKGLLDYIKNMKEVPEV